MSKTRISPVMAAVVKSLRSANDDAGVMALAKEHLGSVSSILDAADALVRAAPGAAQTQLPITLPLAAAFAEFDSHDDLSRLRLLSLFVIGQLAGFALAEFARIEKGAKTSAQAGGEAEN